MDIDKVRALTDTELGGELMTQRRHLYDLRFQLATRQLTDHSQLTAARRTVARVLTVMTERGLNESEVLRQAAPPEPRQATGRVRGRTKTTRTKTPAAGTATTRGATGGEKE